MVRFLHVADLHLGLRITRFDEVTCKRVCEARFASLQQIREKAAELRADFILIAGDVFDDYCVSRFEANRAFAILESSRDSCPVYIIPGNHDPLVPGGVWDQDPWLRDQPHLRVKLLRVPEPFAVPNLPVTIFPCPLKQRRSMDDPTSWIENYSRTDGDRNIRVGLAHGSLNIMRLPDDDHLIRRDAADHYELDYLALGHWHKRLQHKSADGIERTAYCGTHEPMSFPGGNASLSTGWASYSTGSQAELFQDDGHGIALLVEIEGPKAPPQIDPVHVGRLRWKAEKLDVTGMSPSSLFREYEHRNQPELTLLQLTLTGVMAPRDHAKLGQLQSIVQNRYHQGSIVDSDGVLIEPHAEQLAEVVGAGVLKRVLDRLKDDAQSENPTTKRVAEHAMKLLYRIALEDRPS